MRQVPILTYHANNINGDDYHDNDHVALRQDLALIHALGMCIITLDDLMAWRFGQLSDDAVNQAVVLTCDDGTWFDYYDVDHPNWGPQTSFFNILKEHQNKTGSSVHMSCFVIVSEEARVTLDEKCLVGKGWWTDEWWIPAQESGLFAIENHSWDHQHGVLDNPNVNDDSFASVNDLVNCERQLKRSQNALHEHFGALHQPRYFAYPYGDFSQYLRYDYLPIYARKINLAAAFTTKPTHVTQASKRWEMPRYVCNNDWRSPDELKSILLGSVNPK